jgi:hypothetical protein
LRWGAATDSSVGATHPSLYWPEAYSRSHTSSYVEPAVPYNGGWSYNRYVGILNQVILACAGGKGL